MKRTYRLFLTGMVLALAVNLSFAQDFGDFGDFAESDSFGAEGGFSSTSKLETSGSASTDIRVYVEKNDDDEIDIMAKPEGKLDLAYSGNKSDIGLSLCIDADIIKSHPEDIIDELILRGRIGDYLSVEAGKLKVVWGKGDKLHVLDNFNADDYSDFIIPDYIDRRISTPMVRAVVSMPVANLNIEGIYSPLLPTDRFATEGRWTLAQYTELTQGATKIVSTNLLGLEHKANATGATIADEKNYLEYLTYANNLSSNPDSLYPDLWNLEHGQYGLRILGTAGIVDFGASYYYGWFKQPSVNYDAYDASVAAMVTNIMTTPVLATAYQGLIMSGKTQEEAVQSLAVANGWQFALPTLDYDRKQTFGLEAATVIWHFNVRGEAAFNLTDDVEGTDPWVHNNSIAWLGGFDIDLPFWNANLNVQETGTYILHGDECDKEMRDVDYSKNGYTNNKIAANFTASFMNDRILPELTAMYGFENKDLVLLPKITYKPDQNLSFTASGLYIWCGDDNSEFKVWENNSFVNIGASYKF